MRPLPPLPKCPPSTDERAAQVVNDAFLDHVRAGRCRYVRGDTQRLVRGGVRVSVRARPGEPRTVPADVVVLATGFEKPDVGFLPRDLFPESYEVRAGCARARARVGGS